MARLSARATAQSQRTTTYVRLCLPFAHIATPEPQEFGFLRQPLTGIGVTPNATLDCEKPIDVNINAGMVYAKPNFFREANFETKMMRLSGFFSKATNTPLLRS